MPWLPAPHQEGLLFSGKMLLGWGVVVSDASELLFEHIKKLNAQQRTDVPACLIYAPISNLPVTTKHSLFSPSSSQYYFLISSPFRSIYLFFTPTELLGNRLCVCEQVCLCVCVCYLHLPPSELNSIELWNRCGFCN